MSKKKTIGTFALTMINVAAIASLRNLPIAAVHGFSLIFYLGLAALFFFVPIALFSAELVSRYPNKEGGIYLWVKEAFGVRVGFLAIWLQWLGNVIWYPAILTFVGATFLSLIDPSWAENSWVMLGVVLFIFWGCTLLNLRGVKLSSKISTTGVIFGTFVPTVLIVVLGMAWWAQGKPLQISVGLSHILPDFKSVHSLALLCAIALSYVGMEMSEVHASDVANPKKTYPKAIFISMLVIFLIYTLGALSIAFVIPMEQMSLTMGVVQALELFFNAYGLGYLITPVAMLIILGVVTGVSTWIIGPSRGILVAVKEGHLPAIFYKKNAYGMPKNVMILQAAIVTILSLLFLFMPSINSVFILLTVLATQAYMVMYFLMFASALRLRYTRPLPKGGYHLPWKNIGAWTAAIGGMAATLLIFIVGFMPTEEFLGSVALYEWTLILGLIVGCVLPFWLVRLPFGQKKQA